MPQVAKVEAPPAQAIAASTQRDTPFKAACRAASMAYIKAVEAKTGQLPIRNAKFHSQVQQVVKRLGGASVGALEFYVRCNTDPQVVRQLWPLGHFLTQAESIAMQANMGRYISLDDAKAFTSTAQYEQRQQDILAGRL
ncbi:MAG: hypothetical protein EOO40_01170 [Deltaproteobacteria bacterium]|nr:MAG: hypothetical protein EOO40_01170 [Deltaproteobacteria bacterium]